MFCIKTINAAQIIICGQILIMVGFTVKAFISTLNIHVGQAAVTNALKAYSVVNGCSDEFTKLDTATELAQIEQSGQIAAQLEPTGYALIAVLGAMIIQMTITLCIANKSKNTVPYNHMNEY